MLQKRPHVFVGSSAEGLEVAKAVQLDLQHTAECQVWSQGIFGLGGGTLESLVNELGRFDFAILILTPDDLVSSRGTSHPVPRDNVLLELGMFIGKLGRNRTFILVDGSANLKLPSDLAGVTVAPYYPPESGTMQSAVGPACTSIDSVIKKLGCRRTTLPITTVHLRRSEVDWARFNDQVTSRFWACGTSLAPLCDRGLIEERFINQGTTDIRLLLPETREQVLLCSVVQLGEYDRVHKLARKQVVDARHCYGRLREIIISLIEEKKLEGVLEDHLRGYYGTMYTNLTISNKDAYVSYYGLTGSGDDSVTLHIDAQQNPQAYQRVENDFLNIWNADRKWGTHKVGEDE